MSTLKQDTRDNAHHWALIDSKAKEHRLAELFRIFQSNSVDAVVLKGWAVGRFFPIERPRVYTDIDIALPPDDFHRVRRLLQESRLNFQVDLHDGLRNLDTRSWADVFSSTQLIELNGTPVRLLSDEDNLRLTCVHWLTDGGVYKERLWDIFHLVQNRKPGFDWEHCLDSDGEIRRTWVIAAIAAAIEYLEMDKGGLPVELRQTDLPWWFRETLENEWRLGAYVRVPLHVCLGSPKLMFQQIRRRFPPNKIAATVEIEKPIDTGGRSLIQMRSLARRTFSLLLRLPNRYTDLSNTEKNV